MRAISLLCTLVFALFLCESTGQADDSREVGSYAGFINEGKRAYTQGDTGLARVYWERALIIEPRGSEASQNIDYLKRNMPAEVLTVPPFFLYRWWTTFSTMVRPGFWMVLQFLVLGGVMLLLYRLWILRTGSLRDRRAVLMLILLLVILYMAGHTGTSSLRDSSKAVVMSNCLLHEGPDTRSPSDVAVAPGHKVEILDQIDTWSKVSRADKVQGWVETECLTKI